jgi:predicted amidohydrolase
VLLRARAIQITTSAAIHVPFEPCTGQAHWEVLLRARAIECQCYVIAAAQAGVHNERRESHGHALVIDPWGEVIGRLEDPQGTGEAHWVSSVCVARNCVR